MNMGKASAWMLFFMMVIASASTIMTTVASSKTEEMYTIIEEFESGNTSVTVSFIEGDKYLIDNITFPANATILEAYIEIKGDYNYVEKSAVNTSNDDFLSGKINNMSAVNDELMMQPLLDEMKKGISNNPIDALLGDVEFNGIDDIIIIDKSGSIQIHPLDKNGTFGNIRNIQTSASAIAGAVGDLNRDGRKDVCVITTDLEVYLQDINGVLSSTPDIYKIGNNAVDVAVGDVNFDGRDDVVVVNKGDNTITYYIQNSTGKLELNGSFPAGNSPEIVLIGDINTDGWNEVIVLTSGDKAIYVFHANESGLYILAKYNLQGTPIDACLGDVIQDGRIDILIAMQNSNKVSIYNQSANGSLAGPKSITFKNIIDDIAVGDFDYNGRYDIATLSSSNNKVEIKSMNAGKVVNTYIYDGGNSGVCLLSGDIIHNGRDDLLIVNKGDSTMSILRSRPVLSSHMSAMTQVASGQEPYLFATGDLNGDGRTDIVVSNTGSNSVSIYYQTSSGNLLSTTQNVGSGPRKVAIGDINSDGLNDLVVTNVDYNNIYVYYQTSSGGLSNPVIYATGQSPHGVAIGDVNGDGRNDVVVGNWLSSFISVFYQNTSNNNILDQAVNISTSSSYNAGVAIGDVNCDGLKDVVVTHFYGNNYVDVIFQNKDGTLGGPQAPYISLSGANQPAEVVIADVNSDGLNDICVGSARSNAIGIFYQTSPGKYSSIKMLSASQWTPGITSGEFNSDGLTDLATCGESSNEMDVFLQLKSGAMSTKIKYSTTGNSEPLGIASGDFNGDGKDDIVCALMQKNAIGIFYQAFNAEMNGTYESSLLKTEYDVISATPYWNDTTHVQNQTINIEITNDGGKNWVKASKGIRIDFDNPGNLIGFRLKMNSPLLNSTPSLQDITIVYRMRSYPTNSSMYLENLRVWNCSEPLSTAERINITEYLKSIQTNMSDDGETIVVPIYISSDTLGKLTVFNYTLKYDLRPSPPVLISPKNDAYLTTNIPVFQLHAYDPDTAKLKFKIEIGQNNFTKIVKTFNQIVTVDGWDKEYYAPNAYAKYTMDKWAALSDGVYQWRAFVWDGILWSEPSEARTFYIDTKPPTAKVNPLPPYVNTTRFTVSWNGSDPEPGFGLAEEGTFYIQYKDGNGPWVDWISGTSDTSAIFQGKNGHKYAFRIKAVDKAGNMGEYPTIPDTETMIDTTPPDGSVQDDGEVTNDPTKLRVYLYFHDDESEVIQYEISLGTAKGKKDIIPFYYTNKTEITFTDLRLKNGTTYYFNVRAQNGANMWSEVFTTDGIKCIVESPTAYIGYPDDVILDTTIYIEIGLAMEHKYKVVDGDLEYRVAQVENGKVSKFGDWTPYGDESWGETPNDSPIEFTVDEGYAYQFRYRLKNEYDAISDFVYLKNITRVDRLPIPVIDAPTKVTVGKKVTFDASKSTDDDGDPLSFRWEFGDKEFGNGSIVYHRYDKPGKYIVTLYVSDGYFEQKIEMEIEVVEEAKMLDMGTIGIVIGAILACIFGFVAFMFFSKRRKKKMEVDEDVVATEPTAVVPPPPPPVDENEVRAKYEDAEHKIREAEEDDADVSSAKKELEDAKTLMDAGDFVGALPMIERAHRIAVESHQRVLSEVEEDDARRFVEETEKLIRDAELEELQIREAKKLYGHAISFLEDGNYATAMQYAKKSRKLIAETREREVLKMDLSQEGVKKLLDEAKDEVEIAASKGADVSSLRDEIETAEVFLNENDLKMACQHALKVKKIAKKLGEAEEKKDIEGIGLEQSIKELNEKIDEMRAEGYDTINALKMLKLAQSFIDSGNLEAARSYIKKTERILEELKERDIEPMKCPNCDEPIEPDWEACPVCGNPIERKEEEDKVQKETEETMKKEMIREELKCPRCGEEVESDWLVCPACDTPLK